MKVFIVIYYDVLFDDSKRELVQITKCFSTREKAEQYLRERFKLTDDIDVYDFLEEVLDNSATTFLIREYEVD